MSTYASRFVEEVRRRLSGASDVGELFARIDREAASGEPAALLQLHANLAQPSPDIEAWAARSVRSRIEEALALTPRAENLDACLKLAAAGTLAGMNLRGFAARLAQGQLPSELLRVMAERLDAAELRELLACVLHELVARGMDCTGEAPAEALQRVLEEEKHPLAWLPLTRAELERDCVPREFSPGGASFRLPDQLTPDGAVARADHAVSPQPIDDESLHRRLQAAVDGWQAASNGTIESAALSFERGGVSPEMVGPRFLGSLGLSCVPNHETTIWPVGPEHVLANLFAAASSGGAYGGGVEHAYGRLLAWSSLVALAGGAAELSFSEAVEHVERADFFEFATRGPWFAQVAWDLAFLGLPATRERVFVLAATDTD